MNNKYVKPKMMVVQLQGRHQVLQASQQSGMSMGMSGYQKGGDGKDDDGWGD
jgi:hypothetical protein